MFTWVPIHKETVRKILEFNDPQPELLATLREMEGQGLNARGDTASLRRQHAAFSPPVPDQRVLGQLVERE